MTPTNEQKRQQSDRKMRDDMRALAENNRLERALPVLPVRGKQPAKRGSAVWQGGAPSSGGAGGGIASPLTETDASARTYHANNYILSGDMLFGMMLHPVASIFMTDANGSSVELRFDNPPEN